MTTRATPAPLRFASEPSPPIHTSANTLPHYPPSALPHQPAPPIDPRQFLTKPHLLLAKFHPIRAIRHSASPAQILDAADPETTPPHRPNPSHPLEQAKLPSCLHLAPPKALRCPPHSCAPVARPSWDHAARQSPPTAPASNRKSRLPSPPSNEDSGRHCAVRSQSRDKAPQSHRLRAFPIDPKTAVHTPTTIPHNAAAPRHTRYEKPTTTCHSHSAP